jgi:hypothetical protein
VFGPQGETFGRNFVGSPLQFDNSVHGPNGLINYVTNRAAAARNALQVAR